MGVIAAHPFISAAVAAGAAGTGAAVSNLSKKPKIDIPSAPEPEKVISEEKEKAKKKLAKLRQPKNILTTPLGSAEPAPVTRRTLLGGGI
ncbi:MAG: hypothetical protein KatS3mg087_1629 [Patescibacteria group bacterium]|nr:MAG: hypothetical protein KatS3mg087_1629 [Patescibacteria group bacterium]